MSVSIASWLGGGALCLLPPPLAEIWLEVVQALELGKGQEYDQNILYECCLACEFVCAPSLLCLEDADSLASPTPTGS